MAPTDQHQDGRLEDMVAIETTFMEMTANSDWQISVEGGPKYAQIPSVPKPDQKNPVPEFSCINPTHAPDNAFDILRGVEDQGVTGEIISGTGDQINPNTAKKNLDATDNVLRAKGDGRYAKQVRNQKSEFDT